ncbi:LacI family DNA-binding transcriptional regulator [Pelagibacterium halotolerans]|uniref:Periplasmic binding protein/LacI transcriptional regulator n=1 Tax=Pelagibacterium halotolerans (strain DSM 22347 / JCM 15775 / CGMCC 1.7692 / B2) TaxID=1082931 RepID=G4RBJ7_PELHB|nr:LacI family DNA-binding transcriptional regulator [Pelagibacterium halotolerans]AEQ53638.1 periplasmic binding protein/LacI transcriptional regulator [Pelagibacterium halotolerans B2]QJR20189.1 LacI family transcriptional regulator [Pelagibacterium halotolerans]SEA91140.1 transcriptional regulator, LacI family [Pelagibacterium halotolerans]
MKKPTLKDVAREVGVHVSSVSRALDPNARTPPADEMILRIKEAADRLGYRPNRLAAGLRTKRTMTVGVIIPDITNTLFPPILRGIESVLEPLGYAAIIVNTDGLPEREDRLLDVLQERGVDGIIHVAVLRHDPKVAQMAREGLPLVTLNRRLENSDIPCVTNDDDAGIEMALRHLMDLGHVHIGHVAGPTVFSTGKQRLAAFETASRKLGIQIVPAAVVPASRYDETEGARCTDLVMRANPRITGILCANDRLALGALEALSQKGLSCPRDVSVTGFNDIPFLDRIPPGLTTVRTEKFEAGQTAARLLLEIINGDGNPVPPETVLPVKLIIRGSTGPIGAMGA